MKFCKEDWNFIFYKSSTHFIQVLHEAGESFAFLYDTFPNFF